MQENFEMFTKLMEEQLAEQRRKFEEELKKREMVCDISQLHFHLSTKLNVFFFYSRIQEQLDACVWSVIKLVEKWTYNVIVSTTGRAGGEEGEEEEEKEQGTLQEEKSEEETQAIFRQREWEQWLWGWGDGGSWQNCQDHACCTYDKTTDHGFMQNLVSSGREEWQNIVQSWEECGDFSYVPWQNL